MKTSYTLTPEAVAELKANAPIRRAYFDHDLAALRDLKANADLIAAIDSRLPVTNEPKELDVLEPYGKSSDGVEAPRPRPKKAAR